MQRSLNKEKTHTIQNAIDKGHLPKQRRHQGLQNFFYVCQISDTEYAIFDQSKREYLQQQENSKFNDEYTNST